MSSDFERSPVFQGNADQNWNVGSPKLKKVFTRPGLAKQAILNLPGFDQDAINYEFRRSFKTMRLLRFLWQNTGGYRVDLVTI